MAGRKARYSRRSLPLWPQLRAVLEPHVCALPVANVLLFPSHWHRIERPYAELDRALARVVERAAIEKPVTLHTLRHTDTARRLYTLEGDAPVSVWDVACELGHRDTGMIERVRARPARPRSARPPRGRGAVRGGAGAAVPGQRGLDWGREAASRLFRLVVPRE